MDKDSRIYYPMLVPDGDTYDAITLWSEFNKLPLHLQNILTSVELPQILMRIQEEYTLEDAVILKISRLLRALFFQKLTWEDFGLEVESIWIDSKGSNQRVLEFLTQLKKEVTEMNPTQYSSEGEVNMEQQSNDPPQPSINSKNTRYLPILKALATYPELHYQRITHEKIVMKGEREPVPPTIRNWLRVYRDAVGVGRHSTVERGQFLFQNENTKTLSASDREVLALLVKSLEEEDLLLIDTEKKTILFQVPPVTQEDSKSIASAEMPQPIRPSLRFEDTPAPPVQKSITREVGELTFSSGQKMQSEQEDV